MNTEEFAKWKQNTGRRFPSVAAWLNDLTETAPEAKAAQLEFWQQALEPIPLDVALEVNAKITTAEIPFPELYGQYEKFIPYVVEQSRAIMRERKPPAPSELDQQAMDPGPKPRQETIGRSVLDRYLDLESKGLTREQITTELFGVTSEDDQPRFRCWRCQDKGLIDVWSNYSMLAFVRRLPWRTEKQLRRQCTIACQCASGDRFYSTETEKKKRRLFRIRFNESEYCQVFDQDVDSPQAIESFRAFCVKYFSQRARERMKQLELEVPF